MHTYTYIHTPHTNAICLLHITDTVVHGTCCSAEMEKKRLEMEERKAAMLAERQLLQTEFEKQSPLYKVIAALL